MKTVNLLEGSITKGITKLAIPMMATSFIQMAYNITDMIWIGRLGSNAVAAIGLAGMFLWFSEGLSLIPQMGGQVKLGYYIGADNDEKAIQYAQNALQLVMLLGLLFSFICVLFARPLIDFFNLQNEALISDAVLYLTVVSSCVIFPFINKALAGLLTAMGNGNVVLIANTIGIALNLLLDPLLIFGIGPFPKLGILGTALGTVIAEAIVTLIFIYFASKDKRILKNVRIIKPLSFQIQKDLFSMGLPPALQSMTFTIISMTMTRIIGGFGESAIAVQKIGVQLESAAWLLSSGFSSAVNAFMSQNLGNRNQMRLKKGYTIVLRIATFWGLLCNLTLFFFAKPLFQFLLPEADLLPLGISYLRIMSISQVFMCLEITTAGAFSGLGKTIPPSITGFLFTVLRIPASILLLHITRDLNSIWWTITISSVIKGTINVIWYKKKEQSMIQSSSQPTGSILGTPEYL